MSSEALNCAIRLMERLFGGGVVALAAAVNVALGAARDTREPQTPPTAASTPDSQPAAVPDLDDPKLAGHFVGRVIGPDGQPVRGARLFIAPSEPLPTKAGPVRTLSGADGRFEFDAPDTTFTDLDGLASRRQALLIATADHHEPDWVIAPGQTLRGFPAHWDPAKGADFTLRLVRDDVPIHGRLLDHGGQPLAGAKVRVYALRVPWQRDLDAHLQTYQNSNHRLVQFGYDRALYRPAVLPGVATETVTDGDGRFRISGLGRDRLAELMITAPRAVDTILTVMTREGPDVVVERDSDGNATRAILGAGFALRLQPGLTVSGTVRDRDTHQPISGVWVGENDKVLNWLKDENGYQPATSDSGGRFTISGLDPASRNLEVMAAPEPGQPYLMAKTVVDEQSDLLIECARGIPFKLKLVDLAGMPVDADVEYQAVMPNPRLSGVLGGAFYNGGITLNRAARRSKGTYEGFVVPGPGAVTVKTPDRPDYRPAHVDPKAFFAPWKSDWTRIELVTSYGTDDTLNVGIGGGWVDQHDYAAIVLVNPPVASAPLELSATVVRDKPRNVTMLDPEGKPVVGVRTEGLTAFPWDHEPPIRAATVPITKLHPDRSRRITFVKEDRNLIGFLLARGVGDTPYTVRMQPWATVTGRILEEHGFPFAVDDPPAKARPPAILGTSLRFKLATHDDPLVGDCPDSKCDGNGRFRIERLIPGLRYSCEIHRNRGFAGMAFENLVLKPGESRDLGDIRSREPVDVQGK